MNRTAQAFRVVVTSSHEIAIEQDEMHEDVPSTVILHPAQVPLLIKWLTDACEEARALDPPNEDA